jgi:hypothetical protein
MHTSQVRWMWATEREINTLSFLESLVPFNRFFLIAIRILKRRRHGTRQPKPPAGHARRSTNQLPLGRQRAQLLRPSINVRAVGHHTTTGIMPRQAWCAQCSAAQRAGDLVGDTTCMPHTLRLQVVGRESRQQRRLHMRVSHTRMHPGIISDPG